MGTCGSKLALQNDVGSKEKPVKCKAPAEGETEQKKECIENGAPAEDPVPAEDGDPVPAEDGDPVPAADEDPVPAGDEGEAEAEAVPEDTGEGEAVPEAAPAEGEGGE